MAPEQQIDSAEWLGKDEAAAFLGVSPRQIERLAGRGAIAKRTLPKAPGEKAARVVYAREDLERVKAGVAVASPAVSNDAGLAERPERSLLPAVTIDKADTLVALLSRVASGAPASAGPRPWLTLSEAVEYSGLPRAFLRREASRGADFARNVGSPSRPVWRFHREALARPV